MPRFLTEKRCEFTVLGRPLCPARTPKDFDKRATGCNNYAQAYRQKVKLSAKMAAAEQGWKLDDAPIYVVITVWIGKGKKDTKQFQELTKKYEGIPYHRRPSVEGVMRNVLRCLKGIFFTEVSQIAAYLVVRKYALKESDQRVEVLVGAPRSIKELVNDIRNS